MTDIFSSSKWLTSPTAYWTIQYEYQRSGANMLYRFYWKVWLGYSSSYFNDGLQLQLFLDGVENDVTVKGFANQSGWSYEGTTGWYTVPNKTSGSTSFYAKLKDTNTNAIKVTSSTYSLDVAPAYATCVQSLNNRTETSITMNWSSDNVIDYIWYSINDGASWVGLDIADNTSGSYTVSGLTPNTTYKVKTSVRRKDSQLSTDSSAINVTTYDFPYCTSTPDFTIGDTLKLGFYNPLGREFSFYIIANGVQINDVWTISGTSYEGVNADSTQNLLYAAIPNSQSGTYKIKTVWGNYSWTADYGNTFKVKGTEVPTVSGLDYKDLNESVVAITGNDQHIVQNQSNLWVSYGGATAKNGAYISSYTFELNGVTKTSTSVGGMVDFGTVDSSSDLTLTMIVTDSRGLTAKATKKITMLAYNEPSAMVTLARLNNYEDETYLTVDGSISSVNGKNTLAIKYRYKVSNGSYNSFVTIADNTKQTLSLNKNNEYIFNVVVTDAFGLSFDKEYLLNKGVFPLFIDTQKNAVGINEFPAEDEALRVADGIAHFEDGVKIGGDMVANFIVESGTSGMWTYEKWSDGTVKCWGEKGYTKDITTAWGSMFESDAISEPYIEGLFISTPMSFLSIMGFSQAVMYSTWGFGDKDTSPQWYAMRPASSTNVSFYMSYYAIGRWK